MKEDYPGFWSMCENKVKEKDGNNVGGCAFSLLMADIENECLMAMVDALPRVEEMVLMFDGLMICQEMAASLFPSHDVMLRHLEAMVKD